MDARYYDPLIGRFYSNDPVGYSRNNPVGSFNRYSYVNNNPYKYTDPSGMCFWDACIVEAAIAITLVEAAVFVGTAALAGYAASEALNAYNESADVIEVEKIDDDKIKEGPKERGNAPIGVDGEPIEIHHEDQTMDGPKTEMTQTEHRGKGNYRKNHPNKGKSKIDRKTFNKQKQKYWKKQWDEGRFD